MIFIRYIVFVNISRVIIRCHCKFAVIISMSWMRVEMNFHSFSFLLSLDERIVVRDKKMYEKIQGFFVNFVWRETLSCIESTGHIFSKRKYVYGKLSWIYSSFSFFLGLRNVSLSFSHLHTERFPSITPNTPTYKSSSIIDLIRTSPNIILLHCMRNDLNRTSHLWCSVVGIILEKGTNSNRLKSLWNVYVILH